MSVLNRVLLLLCLGVVAPSALSSVIVSTSFSGSFDNVEPAFAGFLSVGDAYSVNLNFSVPDAPGILPAVESASGSISINGTDLGIAGGYRNLIGVGGGEFLAMVGITPFAIGDDWFIESLQVKFKAPGYTPPAFDDRVSILTAPNPYVDSMNLAAVKRVGDRTTYDYARDVSGIVTSSYIASTSVPEPSVIALFGAGLVGLGIARRRRKVQS